MHGVQHAGEARVARSPQKAGGVIGVSMLERLQLEALLVAHRLEFISTCVAHEHADERQAREALVQFEDEALAAGAQAATFLKRLEAKEGT